MIKEVKGDLLTYPVDIICHCANNICVMGGGIARQIKNKYPEAYQADIDYPFSSPQRLGGFSYTKTKDGKIVVNIYGQDGIKSQDNPHPVKYDALYSAFRKLIHKIAAEQKETGRVLSVGFPKKFASDLAGGNWKIVREIIEECFGQSGIPVYIVEYEAR